MKIGYSLLDKEMRPWDTYITLEATVKNMLTSLRAVGELQNPAIRERHWNQLMASTKVTHCFIARFFHVLSRIFFKHFSCLRSTRMSHKFELYDKLTTIIYMPKMGRFVKRIVHNVDRHLTGFQLDQLLWC